MTHKTHLLHDDFDIVQRNTLIVAPDDEFEEVMSEHLEDHAHVGPVDAADLEVIQQLYAALSVGIFLVAQTDLETNKYSLCVRQQ